MHIAFFADQHPASLGGLQVSLALQRAELERLGHTVTACAPNSRRQASPDYGRDSDVILKSIQVGEHAFHFPGGHADRQLDAGFAGKPPVDLVHVQGDLWGGWDGHRFAERHRLPLVHTFHTNLALGVPAVMPFPRATFQLLFAAHRRALSCAPVRSVGAYTRAFSERAHALVVPSQHFATTLREHGVEGEISVLPTGLDDETIDALRLLARPARTRPLLVWPGRVSPEKRLGDLLVAIALSRADIDLRVFGRGGDLRHCVRLARQLHLHDRVTFYPPAPHLEILREIRLADAVIQTSVGFETQGLTVAEAVTLGTPVLLRDPAVAAELPSRLTHLTADTTVAALARGLQDFVTEFRANGSPKPPSERFRQSAITARAVDLYLRTIDTAKAPPRSICSFPTALGASDPPLT